MTRLAARRAGGAVLALVLLAVLCGISLIFGSKAIPAADVLAALLHPGSDETTRIVLDSRVPRTVAALVVGVGLGLSGSLIQSLTRNPLGDPGILGVNAGAAAAVTAGVAFFGTTSIAQDVWFALAGALVVSALVGVMGARGGRADPVRLTLVGVALGAVLTGASSALRLTDYQTFRRLRGWDAGSLVERGWDLIVPVLPLVVVGVVLAILVAGSLNALALGDDLAASLGTRLALTRTGSVLGIAALAGAATALAGPIGFVGLMVPHVARWLCGPDQRWILAVSAVLAPCLLLAADIIGRVILWPGEVPAGLVTAFIGAPALIALARRTKASVL